MDKASVVALYEKANPQLDLKAYVTKICGYKCCESWSRDELIDEFGLGYCFYLDERQSVER